MLDPLSCRAGTVSRIGHLGLKVTFLRASVRHTDAFSGEGQRDATLAGFPAQPVSSAI
jgi:hypothetical protein